ncbi:hypothetical protein ACROYT_G040973 [Oculina patagonica]
MEAIETKSSPISQRTKANGLKINSVVLANSLLPSKFEDSELVQSKAKELLKAEFYFPTEMTAALESTENIYSLGNCGLFSAVVTAYNYHWKLRTSPEHPSVTDLVKLDLMKTRCGIPAVEMLGTEDDWSKLKSKLKVLRTLLEPIENDLGLTSEWWNLVEKVFSKLLATYQGRPDREWWSHIMSYKRRFASGDSSGYRGWITEFLEGKKDLMEIRDMTSGLVNVPLTIEDLVSGVTDTAKLVAGMLGFTLHTDDTSDSVSVQPFQGWSLLLSNDSPFLKKTP